MAKVTINDLLEAGVHFGHQTKRWNPKMKDYVFGARNGISIIDLTKTMQAIADSCNFIQSVVVNGGQVLFVGTKRQAQQIVKETAEDTGMYYVSERWLGGTLTNNVTIRNSIKRMSEIDELVSSGKANSLKKKEVASLTRQATKLHKNLDGIAAMKKLPDVLIVIDACHDNIAIREAKKLNIPIVAITDTNADPDPIDYPVPANDDAVKSIKIIIDLFSSAIKVATEVYQKKVVEEKARIEAEKAAKAEEAKKAKAEKAEKAKEAKKETAKKAAPKKEAPKKEEKAEKAEEKPAAKKPAPKKEAPKKEEKAEEKPAAKKETAKKAAPKKEAKKEEKAEEEAKSE